MKLIILVFGFFLATMNCVQDFTYDYHRTMKAMRGRTNVIVNLLVINFKPFLQYPQRSLQEIGSGLPQINFGDFIEVRRKKSGFVWK